MTSLFSSCAGNAKRRLDPVSLVCTCTGRDPVIGRAVGMGEALSAYGKGLWPRRRGSGRPWVTQPEPWRRWMKPCWLPRAAWVAQPRSCAAGPAASGAGRHVWRRALDAGTGLGAGDDPDHAREPGLLVLARVLLVEGRRARALALLDRLQAAPAAQDRTGSLIEIGTLRALALALAASGDEASAVAALAGALVLACTQGYVRVFADEGPQMAALLGRLVAAQRAELTAARRVPLGCLARLQQAFDAGGARPDPGPAAATALPGIVEPLTSRELEALEMLAAGRPNHAIAREMVVSPRHGQEACRQRLGQARRGQPHRGHRRGPATGPDPLSAA
jgi:hypothetical protein